MLAETCNVLTLNVIVVKYLNKICTEIFNCEVLFREDCTTEEFIDVIVGNRIYMPCIYVRKQLLL